MMHVTYIPTDFVFSLFPFFLLFLSLSVSFFFSSAGIAKIGFSPWKSKLAALFANPATFRATRPIGHQPGTSVSRVWRLKKKKTSEFRRFLAGERKKTRWGIVDAREERAGEGEVSSTDNRRETVLSRNREQSQNARKNWILWPVTRYYKPSRKIQNEITIRAFPPVELSKLGQNGSLLRLLVERHEGERGSRDPA